jgi:hypothetical protein
MAHEDGIPLAQIADIARILGLTRQRANELTMHAGFPTPVAELPAGRVWVVPDVIAWAADKGRETPGATADELELRISWKLSRVASDKRKPRQVNRSTTR